MRRAVVSLALVSLLAGCDQQSVGNSNNNGNAEPRCGNGVVEQGEECDDGEANSDSEPDACRSACRLPSCGDLVVDEGEHCDRVNLAGKECADVGFVSGTLRCDDECDFDVSECNYCGNGTLEGYEECDDGNQDPGDGCAFCLVSEFLVNTYTEGGQSQPAVAMTEDGSFVVVWTSGQQDGDMSGVYGQRYSPDGSRIGVEFRINTQTEGRQNHPAVASATNGSFVVVWESSLPGSNRLEIYGRKFSPTGELVGEEFVANSNVGESNGEMPAIAMTGDGRFVVVWESINYNGPGSSGVVARRFTADASALGEEFQANTYTDGGQIGPAVAIAPDGGFVVVWESYGQDGSDFGIFGQRFELGGSPLDAEFQVNSYSDDYQRLPAVAMADDGSFVVVWTSNDQDGDYTGVFGQAFGSNGAAQGSEFQVNTLTSYNQSWPTMAMAGDGRFVVFWKSTQFGIVHDVHGQRFGGDGSPVGPEFQVNAYPEGDQSAPAAAMSESGSFVVAWVSELQDGSGDGVYAKLYDPEGVPVPVSD